MVSFIESFGMLFLIIVLISLIIKLLKQPIIIAYVLAGLTFSLFVVSKDIDTRLLLDLSEIGITFLLFFMGLEFDFKSLKYMGKDILLSTSLQSIAFFGIGFFLTSLFNFPLTEKIYLSILFMFSSTLLVAKWIEDKKESSSLHGKIILGTLIIQDVLAIIAITILAIAKEGSLISLLITPLKGLALIGLGFFLSKYILNRLLKFSSRYPELLFILSLGICFLFVILAPILGYSTTIGAFIAGVTLANTIYKNDILIRVKPLIIFFNVLFFVGLGFQINLDLSKTQVAFLALLVLLTLVIRPLLTYLALRRAKYDIRTSFTSGLYLAQLSEFGIIIIAAGIASGAVGQHVNTLAILAVILTMILSSYYIRYDRKLFSIFEPLLKRFDKQVLSNQKQAEIPKAPYSIIFFGYYDLSKELILKFENIGKKILVIESSPEKISIMEKENIPYIYSSIYNHELFEELDYEKLELIVSNSIDKEDNKLIIKEVKSKKPEAVVILTAKNHRDALELYQEKADYVIYQSQLHEKQVSILLEEYTQDIYKVMNKKIEEISRIKEKEIKLQGLKKKNAKFIEIESFIKSLAKPGLAKKELEDVKGIISKVSSKAKAISKMPIKKLKKMKSAKENSP